MIQIVIDTCVWLDVAKDPDSQPLLEALDQMTAMQLVTIVLPRTVVDEFQRNKKQVIEQNGRSLSGTFKRVKQAVDRFGDPKKKQTVLGLLNDIDQRIPQLGESTVQAIGKIEKIFDSSTIIEPTDSIRLSAAARAVERRAPFHRGRNAMADAIILETYAHLVRQKTGRRTRFAFVTHNKNDFSQQHGDDRLPHPDIAPLFSRVKSMYFVALKDALRRVNPSLISHIQAEEEWNQECRRVTDILHAEEEIFDKVWYGRHGTLADGVESGKIRVVDKDLYSEAPHGPNCIRRDVWEGAVKAATRVEKKYGRQNLGPWGDFEWGMLSGKLSALRWVLGDDWDMLDT